MHKWLQRKTHHWVDRHTTDPTPVTSVVVSKVCHTLDMDTLRALRH